MIYSIITTLHYTPLYTYLLIDFSAYSRWTTIAPSDWYRRLEQGWQNPHHLRRSYLIINPPQQLQKDLQQTPHPRYFPTSATQAHLPTRPSTLASTNQKSQVLEQVHHYSPSPTRPSHQHLHRPRPRLLRKQRRGLNRSYLDDKRLDRMKN